MGLDWRNGRRGAMSEAIKENTMENTLSDQAAALYSNAEVARWFHFPEPSNHVYILLKKTVDPRRFTERWLRLTSHLNAADEALLRFCCAHLEKHPDFYGAMLAKKWLDCMNNRVNLQGAHWSGLLIERIENSGSIDVPFGEYLDSTAPEVVECFRSTPEEMSDITRINVYLRPSEVDGTLSKLMQLVNEMPFLDFIDRIEVAKEDGSGSGSDEGVYPRLILYLDRALLAQPATFGECLRSVESIVNAIDAPLEARLDFACSWTRNATITEGFMLFKKYLKRVGVIDFIYDKTKNYGVRIESRLTDFL
jgi:hypothetical protein